MRIVYFSFQYVTHRHYAIFPLHRVRYWLNQDVCAIILVFPPEKATNTMEIRVFRREDFLERGDYPGSVKRPAASMERS